MLTLRPFALAVAFSRFSFRGRELYDLDSVNFALGIHLLAALKWFGQLAVRFAALLFLLSPLAWFPRHRCADIRC
jgi:hypothetical protein